MNVNIILDSDYICKKFSTISGMNEVEKLFLIMKKKSNIIIIQDKNGKIINNILRKLIEKLNEIQTEDLPYLKNFITELAKGTTSEYDFITKEKFESDIIDFVKKLKSKNYPVNIVISDKKFQNEVKSYSLEELDIIFDILENYTKDFDITNNEQMLKGKDTNQFIIDFNEYQNFLINTFWCSNKITIIAKEFYDGFFSKNRDGFPNEISRKNNRDRYSEGFKFLFSCFERIEEFIDKKLNIEIITGITVHDLSNFNSNGEKNVDEIINFLENLNDSFIFSFKIYEWNAGDERFPGKGHGRKIFSNYGGFKTEYMPFEIHSKRDKNNQIFYKNTSCQWTGKQNYLKPEEFGVLRSSR